MLLRFRPWADAPTEDAGGGAPLRFVRSIGAQLPQPAIERLEGTLAVAVLEKQILPGENRLMGHPAVAEAWWLVLGTPIGGRRYAVTGSAQRRRRRYSNIGRLNSESPALSVIVPVYNGGSTLGQCLSALGASTLRDFEVIVVDDGSSDDSAAIARSFGVRVLTLEQNSGPAAARNAGVAASSAPLLFFVDHDVIVPPSLLESAMDVLGSRPELSALFCSFTKGTTREDTCSRHKNLLHHWTHQTASPEAATFCGGFGLIRRTAFLAAGGFDPRLRFLEDVDLGYRLHRAGHRILLAKNLQATHTKAYTVRSLLRSDMFERAAPWTRLMLAHRIFRNDLNTRVHNVLSVVAACLLPMSPVLDPRLRLTAALLLMFLLLNRRFLLLGFREYGPAFAARSACLCWLSYVASAVGACFGVGVWLRHACSTAGASRLAQSRGS